MARLSQLPKNRVVLALFLIAFLLVGAAMAQVMRALEQPGLVWKLEVDRAVTGQPVVDGDRLYYSTEDGALFCVGRFDMEEQWRFNAGALVRPRPWFSGSKILFVAGGTLFALDKKSGKEIWKFTAGRQGLKAKLAVDRGLVFTSAPDRKLAALDLNSGSVAWQTDESTSMTDAGIVAAYGMVFFPCKVSSICAVDAETGRRTWDFPLAGKSASNMFVAEERLFFFSSFIAFAIDVHTGRKIWHRKMGLQNMSFSYHNGTVYYLDRECNLQTVDAKTGKDKGTFPIKPCTYGYVLGEPLFFKDSMYVPRLLDKEQEGSDWALLEIDIVNHRFVRQIQMKPRRTYPSGLTYADGKLYYGSIYGLNAIDLRWGYQTLAIRTGGKLSASPARIGNRIVIGTSYGALLFASISDGKVDLQVGLANSAVNTPVVFRDTVLVSSKNGLLAAVDGASGAVKWRYNTGNSASVPVVGADYVLVDDGKGSVHAVAFESGKRRWLFSGGARLFPESVHSGKVFVGGSDDSLHVLDLKTGKKEKFLKLDAGVMSLAVSGDKLLVRTHSGRMYRLDAGDVSERWNTMLLSASGSAPTLSGDMILFGDGKYLVAMDIDGKDVLWRFKAEADDKQVEQQITVAAKPLVHGGVVYAGSDDRTLYAVDLKTGKPLWRFEVSGPVRSEPIVADGLLVFTSEDGGMYAVDISPTPFVWQFSAKGAPTFETSVFGGLVLVGDMTGLMYALDAKSGEEQWRFKPNGKVLSSPAVHKEILCVGDDEGVLYALELKNGKERWRIKTHSNHVGTPLVMEGTVYVVSSKTATTMQGMSIGPMYSYLEAHDIWSGAEKWCFGAVDGIRDNLKMHAGGVVFKTSHGLLISVDGHSGKQRWRINTGSRYGAGRYGVLVEQGRAFILGREKDAPVLVAIDLVDGSVQWKRKVDGYSVRGQSGLVKVSMRGGQKCFSMRKGKTKSCPSKPAHSSHRSVSHGGTAYYYCGRGYLCAKDERSGEEKWRIPVKGYPHRGPSYYKGLLYVTTSMGHVYAFDPKGIRK